MARSKKSKTPPASDKKAWYHVQRGYKAGFDRAMFLMNELDESAGLAKLNFDWEPQFNEAKYLTLNGRSGRRPCHYCGHASGADIHGQCGPARSNENQQAVVRFPIQKLYTSFQTGVWLTADAFSEPGVVDESRIHSYRARYTKEEENLEPYNFYVCQHLVPKEREKISQDLGETMANDPGCLGNNFHVRYCQACRDVYDAEENRFASYQATRASTLKL